MFARRPFGGSVVIFMLCCRIPMGNWGLGEELIQKVLPVAASDETGANLQYLDTPRILQRILSPNLVKFLAGLAFPQLKLVPGKRIDADGNRIRLEGEEYRENGVKVMFKGMEQRNSGL